MGLQLWEDYNLARLGWRLACSAVFGWALVGMDVLFFFDIFSVPGWNPRVNTTIDLD